MTDGIAALCDALRASGIDHVFGVPGTQNVALFDGFRRHRIRTVLASQELAAAFMANGYYRATGKVAALATIPGPGFTYALTGLAEARLDSAAILYLVGQPATKPGRAFQLQAIDQKSIASPLTKACLEITDADDAARVIREACTLAVSGGPGPVMVQLDMRALEDGNASPASVRADAQVNVQTKPHAKGTAHSRTDVNEVPLRHLSERFGRARRPVFYLGQGAFCCASRLERIATSLRVPVLTTPTARGIIAEDNSMVLGFDSLRGNIDAVNQLLDRSDLIVALGCRLGHNGSAGFAVRMGADRLVHVDADPAVPGANYETELPIVARMEDAIAYLESRATASDWTIDEVGAARGAIRRRGDDSREPIIAGTTPLTPAKFFSWLRTVLSRDTIVVTDSGQHQILTRRHFDVLAPRGLIGPTDFQSMGFGLPAAIGATLSAKDRKVIAIVGDGGFLMSGLELLTARREKASILVFVFNDGYLNQIRMQQLSEFGHGHAVELINPNYQVLAESFGIDYIPFDAARPGEIERAISGNVTTLVEVLVGDSMATRMVPVVARAKNIARTVVRSGFQRWLPGRFRR